MPEAVEVLFALETQLRPDTCEPLGRCGTVAVLLVESQLTKKAGLSQLPLALDVLQKPQRLEPRMDRNQPFGAVGFYLLVMSSAANVETVDPIDDDNVIHA